MRRSASWLILVFVLGGFGLGKAEGRGPCTPPAGCDIANPVPTSDMVLRVSLSDPLGPESGDRVFYLIEFENNTGEDITYVQFRFGTNNPPGGATPIGFEPRDQFPGCAPTIGADVEYCCAGTSGTLDGEWMRLEFRVDAFDDLCVTDLVVCTPSGAKLPTIEDRYYDVFECVPALVCDPSQGSSGYKIEAIPSSTTVSVGDLVTVDVEVTQNGVSAAPNTLSFRLSHDPAVLEIEQVKEGNSFPGCEFQARDSHVFLWFDECRCQGCSYQPTDAGLATWLQIEYRVIGPGTGTTDLSFFDSNGGKNVIVAFSIAPIIIDATLTIEPGNDDCSDALPIFLGETPFATVGSTTDGPDLAGFCDPGEFGDDQVHRDVWYAFNATCSGELTLTTCGQVNYDSRIAVFVDNGNCPPLPEEVIGCNDDDPTQPCGESPDFHSTLTVAVEEGNAYLIQLGGFGESDLGSGTLSLSLMPTGPTPDAIFAGEGSGGAIDSVSALGAALAANCRPYRVIDELTETAVGDARTLWVLLGTFPDSRALTPEEGQLLVDLGQTQLSIYIEGADIWGFDPPTPFSDYDGVMGGAADGNVIDDGDDSFTGMCPDVALNGLDVTGMAAPYNQDQPGNDFTDQLVPATDDLPAGSVTGVIWRSDDAGCGSPGYATALYHRSQFGQSSSFPWGRVIAQSWEFGGYGSDQVLLAEKYANVLRYCPPLNDVTCTVNGSDVELTWTYDGPHIAWAVFRDQVLLEAGVGGETSYVDTNVPPGVYTYDVQGGCGHNIWMTTACQVSIGEVFIRGDCKSDGSLLIDDAIELLNYFFIPGQEAPSCLEACDTNGDGDLAGIPDAVFLLACQFVMGSACPPAPFPDCGLDPDPPTSLGCELSGCP